MGRHKTTDKHLPPRMTKKAGRYYYRGFVNGDDSSVLTGSLNCTTAATATSPTGSYPINCSGLASTS